MGRRKQEHENDDITSNCSSFTVRTGDNYDSFLSSLASASQPDRELTILSLSHAESMNQIFPQWVRLCYRKGPMEYEPYDMNMPPVIIPRKAKHYRIDPPLTERGQIVAQTYGRGLATAKVQPYEIFCSPDLKSVQTAYWLIKGMDISYASICIDPSLMSYRQVYPHNIQEIFFSPKLFAGLGYPINLEYKPLIGYMMNETIEGYNQRVRTFFSERIAKVEQKYVVVIADNVVVEMTQNTRIEKMDDILKATRKQSCQLNTIKLKPREVKLVDRPILPFTRSLYDGKPQLWHSAPFHLSIPNHPDIELTKKCNI